MKTTAFVLLAVLACALGMVRYDGYKLVRVTPLKPHHIHLLKGIQQNSKYKVDFWRAPRALGRPVVLMVAPETAAFVMDMVDGMQPKLLLHNVQALLDKELSERVKAAGRRASNDNVADDFPLDEYHRYDDILTWLDQMVAAYPDVVTQQSIGKSYEGRDLRVLTISSGGGGSKPGYWIDAGMHAREWISPATGLYIINELLTKANTTYADTLAAVDFYILPMVNPDGYEFTWTNNRMWRKTRGGPYCSSTANYCCYGADPNRNWDFEWGVSGASTDPCSDVFDGPEAFSEVECKAMADFVTGIKDKLKASITLHSYSEDILYPYGYAVNTFPPDVDDLIAAGQAMSNATAAVHGTTYAVANSAGGLYPASGASDDWSKNLGIKYVYTIELRPGPYDQDHDQIYGFQLPARYIIPTAEEIWPGMLTLVDRIKDL